MSVTVKAPHDLRATLAVMKAAQSQGVDMAIWDRDIEAVESAIATIETLAAAERERCAKLVEGEVYKEIYRTWPRLGDGNRARDSELVKHCNAIAALIRQPGN